MRTLSTNNKLLTKDINIYLISLIILIGFQLTNHSIRLINSRITDDVCYVLNPSKALINEGNLTNSGYAVQMQILRDPQSRNPENIKMSYWFNYIGPVLYFAPFIAVFGQNNNLPFVVGQLILLITIVILLILYGRRYNSFILTLVLINIYLFSSLNLSLIYSPTQLQFIVLMIFIWFNKERIFDKPFIIGLLFGIGYQFRPESIVLLIGLILYSFLIKKKFSIFLKTVTFLLISFILTQIPFIILKSILGTASGSDHILCAIGSSVLGYDSFPNGGIDKSFLNPQVFSINDLLAPKTMLVLFSKIIYNFYQVLVTEHSIFKTSVFGFFIIIFLVPVASFRNLSIKEKADWYMVAISIFLMFILAAMSNSTPRYYEILFCLIFLFFLSDSSIYKSMIARGTWFKNKNIFWIFLIFSFSYTSIGIYKQITRDNSDAKYRQAAKELNKVLNKNERVMMRFPELWLWYCGGGQCLVYDNSTEINGEVNKIYQPQAIIRYVKKGESYESLLSNKELKGKIPLDATYDMLIYK